MHIPLWIAAHDLSKEIGTSVVMHFHEHDTKPDPLRHSTLFRELQNTPLNDQHCRPNISLPSDPASPFLNESRQQQRDHSMPNLASEWAAKTDLALPFVERQLVIQGAPDCDRLMEKVSHSLHDQLPSAVSRSGFDRWRTVQLSDLECKVDHVSYDSEDQTCDIRLSYTGRHQFRYSLSQPVSPKSR